MKPDCQKYLQLLRKMIATPSLSFEEEAVCFLIDDFLTKEGIRHAVVNGNILSLNEKFDPTKKTLALDAHMDTVPAAASYTRDPYDAGNDEDTIWGLGSNDDGGSVVSMLATFAYFYKKEQQLHPGENIPQNDFRYPGPLPSDKEICLVMLADCCEAASRSLEKPTEETLSQLVNDIFRGKIRNGQLDHSELTMHELTVIRNSIINSLKTMFHGRIAYPKDDKKDEDDLFVAAGKDVSAP